MGITEVGTQRSLFQSFFVWTGMKKLSLWIFRIRFLCNLEKQRYKFLHCQDNMHVIYHCIFQVSNLYCDSYFLSVQIFYIWNCID